LQDESDNNNSDALPKENEKHAKGRSGTPQPKNKRKKKEKTHPLKQFYEGSTHASFHIMIDIFVLIQTSSFGG